MKPITRLAWLLAAVAILTTGCLTPQQQVWTCDRAREVFTAYQAAEASGVVTDQKVIANAKVAAAYLASYCGWWNPRTRGLSGDPVKDAHGVLVVHPPR